MQYDFDTDTDSRPECGELGLAVAILQRAVRDLQEPRQREDARAFFDTAWFVFLADGIGINIEAVRARLMRRGMIQVSSRR